MQSTLNIFRLKNKIKIFLRTIPLSWSRVVYSLDKKTIHLTKKRIFLFIALQHFSSFDCIFLPPRHTMLHTAGIWRSEKRKRTELGMCADINILIRVQPVFVLYRSPVSNQHLCSSWLRLRFRVTYTSDSIVCPQNLTTKKKEKKPLSKNIIRRTSRTSDRAHTNPKQNWYWKFHFFFLRILSYIQPNTDCLLLIVWVFCSVSLHVQWRKKVRFHIIYRQTDIDNRIFYTLVRTTVDVDVRQ